MQTNNLYVLKTAHFEFEETSWTIKFYDIFEDKVFTQTGLHKSVVNLISYAQKKGYDLPFRFTFESGAIQFTCAILPKEKEVLIGSKQLGYELSLIRWYKHLGLENQIESISQHANKIASIPVENSPPVINQITHEYNLVDLSTDEFKDVEVKSNELSKALIENINTYNQSIFEKFTDIGLDLTANYKLIRIHLLKFLAILPSLEHEQDGTEVKRIFLESLRRLNSDSKKAKAKRLKGQDRGLPKRYLVLIKLLFNISSFIPAKILSSSIRFVVSLMAKRFIAGENIYKAEASLKALIESGRDATLDQLGELVVSNKEAQIYEDKVIEIIKGMKSHVKMGKRNSAGINKAHVSIKVSALTHDFKPYCFDSTFNSIAPRLRKILIEACKNEVFINIDAEHYHYRDMVLEVYSKVLLETPELSTYADTGIVIQAYLRDGHKHFFDVLELARKRKLRMPIRLVKGAYWDVETVEARAHNFEAPQFLNKEETDIHFRQIAYLCLKNSDLIQLAIASHNIQDHSYAEALRSVKFPKAPIIEHQTLHMTYEALSHGLSLMNWPSRNYIPVGDLIVGMAYLVRRIMENSSQVGILTIMRSHKKKTSYLSPEQILSQKFLKKEIVYDESILKLRREFKNIYPIRTYRDDHLSLALNSLTGLKDKLSLDQNKNLGSECFSPSEPSFKIGSIEQNTTEQTNFMIDSLKRSFDDSTWRNDSGLRHNALLKLADLLLLERENLTSLIILEAGKTLEEAIADVDEAIDFIQFYIKEYFNIKIKNNLYRPKGVFGVIAPWNFPLAIPVGMTCAALVCGNTVILKPAEQTPLIAKEFHRLALEAGIPKEVFEIAFGEAEIGKTIVENNLVDGIVFTGSREVGCSIYKNMKSRSSVDSSKTAITEMGGKNAVIVTNNCELDETVSGIIYAAFAHAGQKCSAASRIIIDEKVKDAFIERFVEATTDLSVGKSDDLSSFINPLASSEDKRRLIELNKKAKLETSEFQGKVHLDLSDKEYPGFCVGPSIYEVPTSRSFDKSSMAQTEVFGPMVHIIPYKDLDEACKIFNSTQYALTGGIYCQSQDDIDYLTPRLECGNIYINRPNTGARVAIEPFGGFKMSGTGPKAGSRDYLYQFMKVENTPLSNELVYSETEVKEFSEASVSKLAERKRVDILIELIDRLMNRYESFFNGIDQSQKDTLFQIMTYFKMDSNLLGSKEFSNRKIPGQLNFDKRDFKLGRGQFIVSSDDINFNTLVDFLFNLGIGNAIEVNCLTQKSFESWKPIVDLAYNVGFSAFNLTVFLQTKSSIGEDLLSKKFEFIVTEKHCALLELIAKTLSVKEDHHSLIKIIISGEEIPLGQWERYIKEYSIPRSFAINTMRHGAPLELEI